MKIALLGDIGLFGRNSMDDNQAIEQRFANVVKILRNFDVVVGNLESPFTDAQQVIGGKSAFLKSSKVNVEILKSIGVQYVSLANNHLFDYGDKGFRDTIDTLEKESISYFGVNRIAKYIDKNGGKIALHGYCCYSTNPVGMMEAKNETGIHPYAPDEIDQLLTCDQTKGYLSILSVHAGEEHVHYPSPDHIRRARRLAAVVPYVYYGHHPHVLQGIEIINGSLIAYSLGNFCFDDVYSTKSQKPLVEQSESNRKTGILALTVTGNRLVDWKIIPINDDGQRLDIDESINNELEQWSSALNDNETVYSRRRDLLIQERYLARKKQRNIEWYIKRLNLNSAIALSRSKKCKEKYLRLVGNISHEK